MEISESFGVTVYHFNVIEVKRMIKEKLSQVSDACIYVGLRTTALEGTLEIP